MKCIMLTFFPIISTNRNSSKILVLMNFSSLWDIELIKEVVSHFRCGGEIEGVIPLVYKYHSSILFNCKSPLEGRGLILLALLGKIAGETKSHICAGLAGGKCIIRKESGV